MPVQPPLRSAQQGHRCLSSKSPGGPRPAKVSLAILGRVAVLVTLHLERVKRVLGAVPGGDASCIIVFLHDAVDRSTIAPLTLQLESVVAQYLYAAVCPYT